MTNARWINWRANALPSPPSSRTFRQRASKVPCCPRARGPGANAVAIARDRALEKTFLRDNGVATARFAIVDNAEAIVPALREVGAPALLKTTRLGYDGKGQARVDDLHSAQKAFTALGGDAVVYSKSGSRSDGRFLWFQGVAPTAKCAVIP